MYLHCKKWWDAFCRLSNRIWGVSKIMVAFTNYIKKEEIGAFTCAVL